MLIRIVRMTFQPEKVGRFLAIFKGSKKQIRSFPGCRELQLHRDVNKDNVYITYSIWENQDALEAYRTSDLFKSVWPKTKVLFLEKPVAFSNKIVEKIKNQ